MSSHTTSVLRRLNTLCIVFKIVAFYKIKKKQQQQTTVRRLYERLGILPTR